MAILDATLVVYLERNLGDNLAWQQAADWFEERGELALALGCRFIGENSWGYWYRWDNLDGTKLGGRNYASYDECEKSIATLGANIVDACAKLARKKEARPIGRAGG